MKSFVKFVIFCLLFTSFAHGTTLRIIRLKVKTYKELESILLGTYSKDKLPEIAGGRPGEWYDIVVDEEQEKILKGKGIIYEVVVEDLDRAKEKVKDSYHSYYEIVSILRNMALAYPSICKVESIGPSYEGRWIYGVKISDNVDLDEDEPEQLFSGCHHAREWASVEVPLFVADTLLRGYNHSPTITQMVNEREIWIFPVINVDGYVYDYSTQSSWRKNREPYREFIGTDLNRNYNGICDSNAIDGWGVINSQSVTHYPDGATFCGRYGGSSPEISAYVDFIKTRNFVSVVDYHSYSELVLAPWGHKQDVTPHQAIYNNIGQNMAQMIQRVNGGYYTYQSSYTLYPTSGSSTDWEYGWSTYVKGAPIFAVTVEIGTQFYEPTSNLPSIKRENFKGALYLLEQGEYLRNSMKGYIPSPVVISPKGDTVRDSLVIRWTIPERSCINLSHFDVEFLKGEHVTTDDFEHGLSNWVLESFGLSNRRVQSGFYSLRADSVNSAISQARTRFPYLVRAGDSLTFWVYYYMENDYDVGIVEVSENLREWFSLIPERWTGTSGGWVRISLSLEPYIGKSLYFRLRYLTDQSVLREGIYVDDVYPVVYYDTSWVVGPISDTFVVIRDLPEGEYFFRVVGYSPDFGKGNYSTLRKIYFIPEGVGVCESRKSPEFLLVSYSYPFVEGEEIFSVKGDDPDISIFDAQGRLVHHFQSHGYFEGLVNCKSLEKGVFFYVAKVGGKVFKGKLVKVK